MEKEGVQDRRLGFTTGTNLISAERSPWQHEAQKYVLKSTTVKRIEKKWSWMLNKSAKVTWIRVLKAWRKRSYHKSLEFSTITEGPNQRAQQVWENTKEKQGNYKEQQRTSSRAKQVWIVYPKTSLFMVMENFESSAVFLCWHWRKAQNVWGHTLVYSVCMMESFPAGTGCTSSCSYTVKPVNYDHRRDWE